MTELVGVLNITPDSFSDGNLFMEPKKALEQADKMFAEGAALVDVGAESTRPGAKPLSPEEEWRRLAPVLKVLVKKYPGRISVDTYHSETAEKALELGEVIINDVTGLSNPAMMKVVARHKAKVIVSHLPGRDIQAAHRGKLVDSVEGIRTDLLAKAGQLQDRGLDKEQIILDPGIGFGKTAELNAKLVEFAKELTDYKVMIGYSR